LYIITLKDLAAKGKFHALTTDHAAEEAAVMDALIVGANDTDVAEKLVLLDETKTLEDAVQLSVMLFAARRDVQKMAETGETGGQNQRQKSSNC
jgi:hypothetical protein